LSLIDLLNDRFTWESFLSYKQDRGQLTARELKDLTDFIEAQGYIPIAQSIQKGIALPSPYKKLINKLGASRKRTVYVFDDDIMWVLKLLGWLLYRFDDCQPKGCYSFRPNFGAHRAFRDIVRTPDIRQLWCCKLDISDYFNSIDVARLLPIIREVFQEDARLYRFFEQLLTADTAIFEGTQITEKRGVMAGTPTSPFLANLYLQALDNWFFADECSNPGSGSDAGSDASFGSGSSFGFAPFPYARYSDDIIIFAPTEEAIHFCRDTAVRIIGEHGLRINELKAYICAPGQLWEFLGLSYHAGVIDVSKATVAKLKGKIRRKARALRRWMLRKDVAPERAQHAFIRSFNRKLFDHGNDDDLSWSRWYFPVLTTSDSLREIDHYLQQYVRYIATGRFSAANYRQNYAALKALGYRSLVHEYYLSRKAGRAAEPSAGRFVEQAADHVADERLTVRAEQSASA